MGRIIESAVNWAIDIANDPVHGYSQDANVRWGNPDYDCSSFIITAFTQAGLDVKSAGATYTGNMLEAFKKMGFIEVPIENHKRGDVLLNVEHHTCLCVDESTVVNASHAEGGGAYGQQGDQLQTVPKGETDNDGEIKIEPYYLYSYGWDYCLRYPETLPNWHAKPSGGYTLGTTEANDNIDIMYALLSNRGWTIEAISGVIGNMCAESGLNPWRWQSDTVSLTSDSKGYGLVQLTPAKGYIYNYGVGVEDFAPNLSTSEITPGASPNDGNAQIVVIAEDRARKYFIRDATPSEYRVSWSNFKNITDVQTAVGAWLYNYEYPADIPGTIAARMVYANAVYEYLKGSPPVPPPIPPVPPAPYIKTKGLPIWLICQTVNKNVKGGFTL